jgi:hypothetical protein
MVLRERMMEAIGSLGLYGMKASFDEILASGIKSRSTLDKILCDKHPLSNGFGEVPGRQGFGPV